MKILAISTKVPYPPTDGGRKVLYESIKQLSSRGHEITLLALSPPGSEEKMFLPLKKYCRLELIAHKLHNNMYSMLTNICSKLPYTIAKYRSKELTRKIKLELATEHYDLVHLEQLHAAISFPWFSELSKIPVLLREQNIESALARNYAVTQKGLRRFYAFIHAKKMRHFESCISEKVAACLVISPKDAKTLEKICKNKRIIVVPAGADVHRLQPQHMLEEPVTIVFIGAMEWPPNADAVLWFVRKILPLIQKQIPESKFYIVGNSPPLKVRSLGSVPGVSVTGYVDDVTSYFNRATVFVVPLLSGGGIRIKILEAMAMGKAIVSTSIGAEGIEICNGKNILIADNAKTFADSVCQLLTDDSLRTKLGNAARSLVEDMYSWERSIGALENAYFTIKRK